MALTPLSPRILIARRLRRLLLLEIVLVFSLYVLLFTVINSLLNYETAVIRALITQFEMTVKIQEVDDFVSQQQQLAAAFDPAARGQTIRLDETLVHKISDRLAGLDDLVATERLPSADVLQTQRSQIAAVREAARDYHGLVTDLFRATTSWRFAAVTAGYNAVRANAAALKTSLRSQIAASEADLNVTARRRLALLALQALVVVISLIGVAYGYIAPAFDRVLKRLAGQNRDLRDMDRVKMEFLSIASHQLKTPLSGLKWNLSLLSRQRAKLSAQNEAYLNQARGHTDAMVRLVTNFLNVSRIEGGRMDYDLVPTDIMPIIRAVARTYDRLAKSRDISITLEMTRSRLVAQVDPLLFRQVMQNLVDNAIFYNRRGGAVVISANPEGRRIIATVADTGEGISVADRERLFTQFFRGRNAKTLRPDGSGLGLYFVKKIVQKMGGSIHCVSRLGHGSRFVVIFRRA